MSSNTKNIVTHNGGFHADEVFAYVMLKKIYPDNKLIRSRDMEEIEKADIAIDVGKIYNPSKNRFDHHQENCSENYTKGIDIPMSSAGMVYKTYGRKFLEMSIGRQVGDNFLFEFYKNIIMEVDAIDNGVKQEQGNKFFINTGVTRMVNRFNSDDSTNHEKQYKAFMKAVEYVEMIVSIIIEDLNESDKLIQEETLKINKLLDERKDNNYIVIDFDCKNWYTCIKNYEYKNKKKNIIDWIVYQSGSTENEQNANNEWKIKTVGARAKKLKDEQYLKTNMKNPDDFIFVHKALFVASSKTFESAIDIVNLSNK